MEVGKESMYFKKTLWYQESVHSYPMVVYSIGCDLVYLIPRMMWSELLEVSAFASKCTCNQIMVRLVMMFSYIWVTSYTTSDCKNLCLYDDEELLPSRKLFHDLVSVVVLSISTGLYTSFNVVKVVIVPRTFHSTGTTIAIFSYSRFPLPIRIYVRCFCFHIRYAAKCRIHSDNYTINELIEHIHTKLFQASPYIDARWSLKKLCMDVFNQLVYMA